MVGRAALRFRQFSNYDISDNIERSSLDFTVGLF